MNINRAETSEVVLLRYRTPAVVVVYLSSESGIMGTSNESYVDDEEYEL